MKSAKFLRIATLKIICGRLRLYFQYNSHHHFRYHNFHYHRKMHLYRLRTFVKEMFIEIGFNVPCRVQIWKKIFYQNSDKFGYSFIKSDIMFMYLLCIYKKLVILTLFKTDTLNFTMHILTILTCSLKTYVIRLHNLISINIFYTIKDHSFSL